MEFNIFTGLIINGQVNMAYGYDIRDLKHYKSKLFLLNDMITNFENSIKCNTIKLMSPSNYWNRSFYENEIKEDKEYLSHLIELKATYFSEGCEKFYCKSNEEYIIYCNEEELLMREAKEYEVWKQMKELEEDIKICEEQKNKAKIIKQQQEGDEIKVCNIVRYCCKYNPFYALVINRTPKKITIQQIKFDVDYVVDGLDGSTTTYYKHTYKLVNNVLNVKESSCYRWDGDTVIEYWDCR